MSDYESVNKIKSLQQGIEAVTGNNYSDLTAAVQELKNGYGGSGIIEVSELPTENIDENAVYKVFVSGDPIVYIRLAGEPYTVEEFTVASSSVNEVNVYFVDELPSEMPVSGNSIVHAYFINSTGIGYVDMGDYRGTIELAAVLGMKSKGYTDDITLETEDGVYAQRNESSGEYVWYIRENGEWKRISPDVQTKEVSYTENGDYEILPDSGKQLSKATVKVAVPERYDEGYEAGKLDGYSEGYTASQNARQEKPITQNGEYTPDEGYSGFSKVTVNVTDVDTVDGWHVDVRSDGSAPPSGTFNTITFVYGG